MTDPSKYIHYINIKAEDIRQYIDTAGARQHYTGFNNTTHVLDNYVIGNIRKIIKFIASSL